MEEVFLFGVEPLACDGLPLFLFFFVAAGMHGCFETFRILGQNYFSKKLVFQRNFFSLFFQFSFSFFLCRIKS